MNEAARPPGGFFVHEVRRCEITHFPGNLCPAVGSIEPGNHPDPRFPLAQSLPVAFQSCTQRGNHPHTRYNHSSFMHYQVFSHYSFPVNTYQAFDFELLPIFFITPE